MLCLYRPSSLLLRTVVSQTLRPTNLRLSTRFIHGTYYNLQSVNNGTTNSNLKGQINDIKQTVSKYATQFSDHFQKLKISLKEANKKIAEQERELKDEKLNFKMDMTGSSNNKKIEGLPSEREMKRRQWSRKMEFYMDSLQETLFTATRALNDVTGYSSIQQLRNSITGMENELDMVKEKVKEYKSLYNDAIHQRIQSQREVNDLLQRKSSWSSNDLERFTQLYKDDTINSKRVEEYKAKLNDIEMKEDQLNDDLYRAILTRYHEEQIWSDKIRRTSTWGTFILLGINICLFLILQLLLEPWKRRRLTRNFEEKVISALDKYSKEQEKKFNLISGAQRELIKASNLESKTDVKNNITQTPPPLTSTHVTLVANWKDVFTNMKLIMTQFWTKVIQIPKHPLNDNITFTGIEIYLYSGILIILGNLLSRLI